MPRGAETYHNRQAWPVNWINTLPNLQKNQRDGKPNPETAECIRQIGLRAGKDPSDRRSNAKKGQGQNEPRAGDQNNRKRTRHNRSFKPPSFPREQAHASRYDEFSVRRAEILKYDIWIST